VAVFIDPDSDISAVWFWLDDTGQSPPADNGDNASPYDYVGGTASAATMWDTTGVADGSHTMTVRLRHLDNSLENVTVTFTVDNTSSGFPLWWVEAESGPASWARPAQAKPVSLAALYYQASSGSEIISETYY